MKIFILPGTLHCNNLGDLAMLQVALQRLGKIWPNAVFFVLTGAEAKLKIYCPEAVPVPVHGARDIGAGLLAAIQRQTGVRLK